jgi:predicted permease
MADRSGPRRLFQFDPRSPEDVDAELRDEMAAHIAIGVDELIAQGVDPAEAERQVRARFGDLDRELPSLLASARRRSRITGRRSYLRGIWRDVAYSLRQMRRSPPFVAGIVLSLGFGIGASATVYSWMQSMLLRPLPMVQEVDRLLTVRPEPRHGFGISLPEYESWRDATRSFTAVAAVSLSRFAVSANPDASESQGTLVYGMFVTANYFELLGVEAALGRTLAAGDDRPGAEAVAVISDGAWRRLFDARPDIAGSVIRINGYPVRIAGVAPARFWGNHAVARFDLWVPVSARPLLVPSEALRWRAREHRWLDGIARLAPNVTLAQANTELQSVSRRDADQFAESRGRAAVAIPLDVGGAELLTPLFIAVTCVLLLVLLLICANVANLLFTRAAARRRELAIRLALGATRGRIAAQLLTESALLAVAGAGIGIVIASFGERILAALTPPTTIPLGASFAMDPPFILFIVLLTTGCVVAFGLAPALMASRVGTIDALKQGGAGSTGTRSMTRSALVIVQYAFAMATLVGAAVVLQRDREVRRIDLGFRDADAVLLAQTEISLAGQDDLARWGRLVVEAVDEVGTVPGVERAAIASFVPLGLMPARRELVDVPSAPAEPGESQRVLINSVDERYFELMGIPVLRGRGIAREDETGRPVVVVVNEAFADRYFDQRPELGMKFRLGGGEVTIVGVVRNGRYDFRNIDDASIPLVYRSWRQSPEGSVTFHVRADGDPMQYVGAVQAAVRRVDPSIFLHAPTTLEEFASVPFYLSRSSFVVLAVLSVAALLLASIGLFTVVSYGVTLRTQEIGVRMALGATRSAVTKLFLGGALRLVGIGAAFGLALAVMLVALLRGLIPLLPAAGPVAYAAPVMILGVLAVVAGIVPAHHAARVDPAITLRAD